MWHTLLLKCKGKESGTRWWAPASCWVESVAVSASWRSQAVTNACVWVPSLDRVAGGLTAHIVTLACVGVPYLPAVALLANMALALASVWVPALGGNAGESLRTLARTR